MATQQGADPLHASPRQVAQRARIAAAFGPAAQLRDGLEDEEAPLQARPAPRSDGLPAQLRAGAEALSGLDLSDVRVHRNSDKPAQLNALAYAQGNDIHLGPGQEQHLPHEAWHVVQQAQGRVAPTMQMASVAVNDDTGLEGEADAMGERAAAGVAQRVADAAAPGPASTLQRILADDLKDLSTPEIIAAISRDSRLQDKGLLRFLIDHGSAQTHERFVSYLRGVGENMNVDAIVKSPHWGWILGAPPFEGLIADPVRQAIGALSNEELTKDGIPKALKTAFEDYPGGVHAASRQPAFSMALLECVRSRQSASWVKATQIESVPRSTWSNGEVEHWNLRHYSNKCSVVLGEDLGDGIFTVADVRPPPFREILSSISVATLPGTGDDSDARRYASGDNLTMAFSSGQKSSGHTTGKDWSNIGNVGDTFYGLFYKDEPATGLTPGFIKDALYFAKWSVEEFGEGWASEDWLGTADDSKTEGAKAPSGKARSGQLEDVIADIFPEAATRDFGQSNDRETDESKSAREFAFSAMTNFEVKKHGGLQIQNWEPVATNVSKVKTYWVNTKEKTAAFIKFKALLPQSVKERLSD